MTTSGTQDYRTDRPLVWALVGGRTGDNRQVNTLARALVGQFEEKNIRYTPLCRLPHYLTGASLSAVKKPDRMQLRPPWPDLVIASGRRSVGPARWIKRQSGNRTKLVQLGRPRAPLHLFDLVITTPQYGLPEADNVLSLTLPLQTSAESDGGKPGDPFAGLPDLPRPWTGLLIGGSTWPFVLDARAGSRLGREISRWIGKFGGSVLVTTSPRSDPRMADEMEKHLAAPHFLHRWSAAGENPYRAILRSSDQLIVTSDSVSMLADACRSRKPTAIWKSTTRNDPVSGLCRVLGDQAHRDTPLGALLRYTALKGLFTPPRHVENLTHAVVASKRACWFDPNRQIEVPLARAADNDLVMAVDRVRALFG